MKKREQKILEMLTRDEVVDVAAFADALDVSQVTIRKDLDELERRGIIIREHGFARLQSADNLSGRIAYHYEEKLKIAQCAASLVQDGDTVMIESGSCCALLAEALAATKHHLTLVTNSAFIAGYIRGRADFRIVLLGGIYQPDAQVMVGPMVRLCAENFYARYFFFGVDSYARTVGFSNRDPDRAQAVRDMAPQSANLVVLTESEKFSGREYSPINVRGREISLITDGNLDPEWTSSLEEKRIRFEFV